jgi:hypothetical protein
MINFTIYFCILVYVFMHVCRPRYRVFSIGVPSWFNRVGKYTDTLFDVLHLSLVGFTICQVQIPV